MSTSHKLLQLEVGATVGFRGRPHRIKHILTLNELLLVDATTNELHHAKISELDGMDEPERMESRSDLIQVADKVWAEAARRHEIIAPLLDKPDRTRQDVAERAKLYFCHTNTLYNWIGLYERAGLLTSLLPKGRSDKGSTRLTPEADAIIQAVLDSDFLTKQCNPQQKVITEIRGRCLNANIEPPHANTVRKRIRALAGEHVMASRKGRKVAQNFYAPIQGKFPGADWPLSVVQMDHTKLDIILVDDQHRRPVGRPWITLAIDVFSRMVVGFYVSFDPPGALSAGQCLANAILPKDAWLVKHEIKGEWPCWGLPAKIHMDNGREFRGVMLQRACHEYGIDIEWRPVARPNFGGHIERLLGTFAKEIHSIPGTTFSNTAERGDYDSVAAAALTLEEFEKWLVTLIVDIYHQRLHSEIVMPPIAKYRQGIFGDANMPGKGLPARIRDEGRLRLDLMPFEERTVQPYGVVIDDIHYYDDVLRRWINAPDLKNPKRNRRFMFRRDPRDISTVWFYDPEINVYYPIPYRDTSQPAMSIWELREARRRVEADGRGHVDERSIFEAYKRLRAIEDTAKAKTTAVRRAAQRRRHGQVVRLHTPQTQQALSVATPAEEFADIQPFDEMDDMA